MTKITHILPKGLETSTLHHSLSLRVAYKLHTAGLQGDPTMTPSECSPTRG